MNRPKLAVLVATAALGAGLASCYDEARPEYADIGVRWLDASNQELGEECIRLPYLPGGTVDHRIDIGSGLTLRIVGMSRNVELTLEGTSEPVPRTTITNDSLRLGYTGLMDAVAPSGDRYRIVLFGPCDPSLIPLYPDGGYDY